MSAHKHPENNKLAGPDSPAARIPNRHFPLGLVTATLFAVALVAAATALLLPRASHAQQAALLSTQQQAEVRRVQQYLNSISTVQSRFIQVTSKGALAHGRLWLKRPGRMRLDYDPPVPILIVSDGETMLFKDEELDQFSYARFDESPASFFIGDNVDFFNKDLTITDFVNDAGALYLSMVRKSDPRGGALTLVMNAEPMALKKWMVVDAQGIAITVSLLSPTFGKAIDPALFEVEQRWRAERDKKRSNPAD